MYIKMNELKELLKDMPEKVLKNIKHIFIGHQTYHIGKTGFGETIVKPYYKIEFKEN